MRETETKIKGEKGLNKKRLIENIRQIKDEALQITQGKDKFVFKIFTTLQIPEQL